MACATLVDRFNFSQADCLQQCVTTGCARVYLYIVYILYYIYIRNKNEARIYTIVFEYNICIQYIIIYIYIQYINRYLGISAVCVKIIHIYILVVCRQ